MYQKVSLLTVLGLVMVLAGHGCCADNTLEQPPKGFVALFNGKDLTGWKGLVADPIKRSKMSPQELAKAQLLADKRMAEHWQVKDGALVFDGKGDNLCTVKDYGDFELLVDFKIEAGSDSGIYLRASPQVQIWDTANWPEGSGGLYNNKKAPSKPLTCADNPIGQWNTFRITMVAEKVTVYLNDVLVVDDVVMENYWEPNKPVYSSGPIELQAHKTVLSFRNIFIRQIPQTETLFNGKDLTGWQDRAEEKGHWKVENGVLCTEGSQGGWLSTTEEYENFELELEFRVPPGGNSGIFLRASHEHEPNIPYGGALEIQILDDYADKHSDLKPWQYTGSLYSMKAPARRVSKRANQWQKMVIVCNGPKLQVTLNGERIVDTNLNEHMDKLESNPALQRRKGYIGLQNYDGMRVEFRNIKISQL
ncbi:MAG: DUF1080 domain-containing protein [Sedimentisphaerales bacterium]|nr:DUF1080 domain-containing protein [Sedimentisphaerales bacterium]